MPDAVTLAAVAGTFTLAGAAALTRVDTALLVALLVLGGYIMASATL